MLKTNIKNRELLINSLKEEFIGPIHIDKTNMKPLVITEGQVNVFHSKETFFNDFYYKADTEEEIIKYPNTPITQYSTGMLFPKKINSEDEENIDASLIPSLENNDSIIDEKAQEQIETIRKRSILDDQQHPDLLEGKDDNKPSSMAFTFFVKRLDEQVEFKVNVKGGMYTPFDVRLETNDKVVSDDNTVPENKESVPIKPFQTQWWYREPINLDVPNFKFDFKENKRAFIKQILKYKHLTLEVQGFLRILEHEKNSAFITISLKNISNDSARGAYKNILFQSELTVENINGKAFSPFPTDLYNNIQTEDLEELSNKLLYHNVHNYALGHGCSVGWDEDKDKQVTKIYSTFFPEHEITNITPDIKDKNGKNISISMLDLADPSNKYQDILKKLSVITEGYRHWIEEKRINAKKLKNKKLFETANRHLDDCQLSLNRMQKGLDCLKDDEKMLKAFQLTNLAMFLQQIVGKEIRTGYTEGRKTIIEPNENVFYDIPSIDELKQFKTTKGKWRAFQIAFLIMLLPSFREKNCDRNIADLIWFPTGGGKTEAYLAVASFSMLYRRLKNPQDASTDIIMRYTLRLLTADQFQRSARLICSLDMIRQQSTSLLGTEPFSIGIWLGSSTTPNKNKDAKEQLKEWEKSTDDSKAFLVKSCPWCGSKLGKYKSKSKHNQSYNNQEIIGYTYNNRKSSLQLYCPDSKCKFNSSLPIYIVDETIYNVRPTFIIGTVDKFAMLAWEPKARNIFGLDEEGNRTLSPPSLIIQDELHLISGPLGSAVGLYEVIVEELCTDRRSENIIKPKIICATATVRGYKQQIKALYAKLEDNIRLFPSPGITHDDSYFAQVHLDENGLPSHGRKYIGIASNIIGIQQLQVKTYTTLLQKAKQLENPDPFWSLLAFYNSIRELGGSLTLFQTDISNYTIQFRNKHHISKTNDPRYLNNITELTSRLSNGEVTDAIGELKKKYPDKSSIDVCLASNIIEVGVDIDRLSLMSIVGQPKNTAQYIQVSGRIGRAWDDRPGLVITLYKLSMSRDKSHFEHFKEYHQSLYAHVEATSITPFSEPSLKRGLYGVIIAWLRQLFGEDIANSPKNIEKYEPQLNNLKEILGNRIHLIDPKQETYFDKLFEELISHMIKSEAQLWKKSSKSNDYFLMYSAGSFVEWEFSKTAKPVLTSMRNVDASCMGTVTNEYGLEDLT
ncbi:helicase-related protein [Schinkia sp. CFF1]